MDFELLLFLNWASWWASYVGVTRTNIGLDGKAYISLIKEEYACRKDSGENFEFIDAYDYETINHGKILVIHGDQYDVVTSNAKYSIFST